jgi:hypothetical protein
VDAAVVEVAGTTTAGRVGTAVGAVDGAALAWGALVGVAAVPPQAARTAVAARLAAPPRNARRLSCSRKRMIRW